MSFAEAKEVFGGQKAIDSEEVTLHYMVYDLAAEYWKTPFVEDVLNGMTKRQLLYWLAYREVRSGIEKKRMDEQRAESNKARRR